MPEATEMLGDGSTVPCRICGEAVSAGPATGSRNPRYECPVCGSYQLLEHAAQHLYELTGMSGIHGFAPSLLPNHHLISAVLRERHDTTGQSVVVRSLDELRADARPLEGGYLACADKLLLAAERRLPQLGGVATFKARSDYPLAWVRNNAELAAVAELAEELGYLTRTPAGLGEVCVGISATGWRRLQALRESRPDQRQAFVAMWFNSSMTSAYVEGFAPALRATGYRPLRIDQEQHNEKVDDRIIAAIRRSGVVISDFTGNRGGVYFEAGFARGLGIPVIWTCRQAEFDAEGVHFDTRQFNHILWTTPDDLREKLTARIQATLPCYPPLADRA